MKNFVITTVFFFGMLINVSGQSEAGIFYGFNNYQNLKQFSQDRYYPNNSGGMIDFGLYYNQYIKEQKGVGVELLFDSKTFNFIDNQTLNEVQQRDDFLAISLLYLRKVSLIKGKLFVHYNTGIVFSSTIDRAFYYFPGQNIDERFIEIAKNNYQKIGLMADLPITYYFPKNMLVSIGVRLNFDLFLFNDALKHNRYFNFPVYMKVGYNLSK